MLNTTLEGHVFHGGDVESRVYWEGDELRIHTTGYGYGLTPLNTAANIALGTAYFTLWQKGVDRADDLIRVFGP